MLGDERLVEQIRRGNQAAFEVAFERHHRGILSFARHMLGNREEAEDAVQQTFVSAYNDLVSNDRAINLKPWLYTIARNRCLSMLRARREQAAEIPDLPTAGLAQEVEQRDDLRELLADMRDLPEDQRAALILSELGGLSHNDIGQVLEVEPVKVKSLVFQARSSLIETRKAREIPCSEIREQLATLTGGALRRAPLRRHLKTCEGCREFRDDVRRQRTMMAAILPVVPTVGLKSSALAAVGIGSGKAGGGLVAAATGGSGAASGGAAGGVGALASGAATSGAGGSIGALLGGGAAAKIATVAVLAGGTAAVGGVAIKDDGGSERDVRSDTPAAQQQASGAPGAAESPGPGGAGSAPGVGAPIQDGDDASGDRPRPRRTRARRGGPRRGGARRGGERRQDAAPRKRRARRRAGGRRGGQVRQPGTGRNGRGERNLSPKPRPPRRAHPPRPPIRVPDPAPETTDDALNGDATRELRPPRAPSPDPTLDGAAG
jgi:RNA polymerase sigma factor (sigma-70 family)